MCTLNILGSVGALEYICTMQHMNDPLEGDGCIAVRNV